MPGQLPFGDFPSLVLFTFEFIYWDSYLSYFFISDFLLVNNILVE